ncbi:transcriptional regulator [Ralstonia sp. A12]|uniref:response regulator transcription factor n=1 Tax=Ralstonia sp. A12 TaxID=1217052 RepID=UPI000574C9E6|nr:response regulator transcription factor [Ralstonia sp. A12]KHK49797.1 transcriptional regulator [Ralstonia sp. A12]
MRIASVEDDPAQAVLIKTIVESAGHECESFRDGVSMIRALRSQIFDLFILDRNLPDIDGQELVRWIRNTVGSSAPVIFVTSYVSESFVVEALNAGADEYVPKPIRANELTARISALLRRSYPSLRLESDILQVGPFSLDAKTKTAMLHGKDVGLAPREFDVAMYLFKNIGQLVPRDAIEKAVWGRVIGPDSRTLDTHVSRVRMKLGVKQENGVRLINVYSHGFRLIKLSDDEH